MDFAKSNIRISLSLSPEEPLITNDHLLHVKTLKILSAVTREFVSVAFAIPYHRNIPMDKYIHLTFILSSPVALVITRCPEILFDVSPSPLCPSSLQFHTTDKFLWKASCTCHSYFYSQLILSLEDTLKFSLLIREYFVPTALQFLSTWIPLQIISRPYRVSTHPQLFMCFTMVFEILFDLPKILSNLLLLKFFACLHYG